MGSFFKLFCRVQKKRTTFSHFKRGNRLLFTCLNFSTGKTVNFSQFCKISVTQRIFHKLFWGSITQIRMKSFSVVKYFNILKKANLKHLIAVLSVMPKTLVKLDKCYKCKKEWSVRKGSILEDLKVSFSKFIQTVKLFVLEAAVNKAYKELDLACNTTHKIYTRLRQCIYKTKLTKVHQP